MSVYSIAIPWSGKDALADSNPDKVVSGGDFNTEFTAVQTAVNSKADLAGSASQAFSATTAAAGTSTTQVATTAFVSNPLNIADAVYPVGAIFTTITAYADSAAVVAAIGGTTWLVFGTGKVLVGVDGSDTDFDVVNSSTGSAGSGGTKTHTLTTAEMPAHTHSYERQIESTDVISIHDITRVTGGNNSQTTGSTGDGGAHNNVQPYITVYMWRRTA